MWIIWEKRIVSLVQLDSKDKEEESEEHPEEYTRIDSNLKDIFQGSTVYDAMNTMFAQIKKHVEHPAL